jgi:hypothetical protein
MQSQQRSRPAHYPLAFEKEINRTRQTAINGDVRGLHLEQAEYSLGFQVADVDGSHVTVIANVIVSVVFLFELVKNIM